MIAFEAEVLSVFIRRFEALLDVKLLHELKEGAKGAGCDSLS
jgi:hypothetical protein